MSGNVTVSQKLTTENEVLCYNFSMTWNIDKQCMIWCNFLRNVLVNVQKVHVFIPGW